MCRFFPANNEVGNAAAATLMASALVKLRRSNVCFKRVLLWSCDGLSTVEWAPIKGVPYFGLSSLWMDRHRLSRQFPARTLRVLEERVGGTGIGELLGLGIEQKFLPLQANRDVAQQADLRDQASILKVSTRLPACLCRICPVQLMTHRPWQRLRRALIRLIEIGRQQPHLLDCSRLAIVDRA